VKISAKNYILNTRLQKAIYMLLHKEAIVSESAGADLFLYRI
jgi:hypothetical protein